MRRQNVKIYLGSARASALKIKEALFELRSERNSRFLVGGALLGVLRLFLAFVCIGIVRGFFFCLVCVADRLFAFAAEGIEVRVGLFLKRINSA